MTIEETSSKLATLLKNDDEKVIALTGAWGTGKTHLWRAVQSGASEKPVKDALYVSLFGVGDIRQLKLKLFQAYLPRADSKLTKAATDIATGLAKLASSLHAGFSSLDELALMSLPQTMGGRFIVLDDIERRRDSLGIDEVLGFIDEFTQRHGARFLLILNTGKLKDGETWDVFREKVIDAELMLITSPAEAFKIAAAMTPHGVVFPERVEAALGLCKVTNIRVARKVIKAANAIYASHRGISPAIQARTVPSVVLLAAIAYKGIDDGPDQEFVLSRQTRELGDLGKTGRARKEPASAEEAKQTARVASWSALLDQLGIDWENEFEILVAEYLGSGSLDPSALDALIDRFASETQRMDAQEAARQLIRRLIWDHRATDEDLLAEARELASRSGLLDEYMATALASKLAEWPALASAGEDIMAGCIAGLRARQDGKEIEEDDGTGRPLHPSILDAMAERNAELVRSATLGDTVISIATRSGFGPREEAAMAAATAADFERELRNLGVDDFQAFTKKMNEMLVAKQQYVPHFGGAMDRYAEACASIVADPTSGRLGPLVKTLLERAGLGMLLLSDPSTDSPAGGQ